MAAVDLARRTVEYCDRRTSHGSTLSFLVHADVLAVMDPEFVGPVPRGAGERRGRPPGGTTAEGLHLGVMAGTPDIIQRCYAGTHVGDEVLRVDPHLPGPIERLSFPLQIHGAPLRVTVDPGSVTLSVQSEGIHDAIRVGLGDDVRRLEPGTTATFETRPAVGAGQ